MLPILKHIIPNWSGYKTIRESSMEIHGFVNVQTLTKFKTLQILNIVYIIQNIVQQQYKSFDPTHERHFLDMYFKNILDGKEDFSSKCIWLT